MPELPEVETIVNRLKSLVTGKKIINLNPLHPKSFSGDINIVKNREIKDISRRAKYIRFHLGERENLLVHLKMTGQLIWRHQDQMAGGGHPTADWVDQLPGKHTRVILNLSDDSTLFFNDQRIFGWVRHLSDEEVESVYSRLGPDVNTDEFSTDYLAEKLIKRKIPVKQALMDNAIVCGLGNIYVCDALHLAKVDPKRSVNSLLAVEIIKLVDSAKQIIDLGIKNNGTTFDGKYVGVDGLAGNYQDLARVYGREGEKCRECGTKIVKIRLGGRGTYFCPGCQS